MVSLRQSKDRFILGAATLEANLVMATHPPDRPSIGFIHLYGSNN